MTVCDTDQFTTPEIIAMTALGESESLGDEGITDTVCTVMNRARANLKWMGGSDVRAVCLAHDQYDAWWPATGNSDRQRIIDIATQNPLYRSYVAALVIAQSAIAGNLTDTTNNAVSYFDDDGCDPPTWSIGKTPCLVKGTRKFYDLDAVMAKAQTSADTPT